MTDHTAAVVARFHSQDSEVPKHARLRAAIVDAVKAGELRVGTKLAGERELGRLLGLSLGTTQKALGRLVDDGFLVRRQGHGTFVGSTRQPVDGSWHYRFVGADGASELPVFATILERRLVDGAGPWSAVLGADPKGYVLLRRRLEIGGKFACASRIFLSATRFGRLLRVAGKRLCDVNLKSVLERDHSAPTLSADGVAHVIEIGADDAEIIGVASPTWGLQLDIVGRSFGRVPITFQRMIVPPTPHGLKLDFGPPEKRAGISV